MVFHWIWGILGALTLIGLAIQFFRYKRMRTRLYNLWDHPYDAKPGEDLD